MNVTPIRTLGLIAVLCATVLLGAVAALAVTAPATPTTTTTGSTAPGSTTTTPVKPKKPTTPTTIFLSAANKLCQTFSKKTGAMAVTAFDQLPKNPTLLAQRNLEIKLLHYDAQLSLSTDTQLAALPTPGAIKADFAKAIASHRTAAHYSLQFATELSAITGAAALRQMTDSYEIKFATLQSAWAKEIQLLGLTRCS